MMLLMLMMTAMTKSHVVCAGHHMIQLGHVIQLGKVMTVGSDQTTFSLALATHATFLLKPNQQQPDQAIDSSTSVAEAGK